MKYVFLRILECWLVIREDDHGAVGTLMVTRLVTLSYVKMFLSTFLGSFCRLCEGSFIVYSCADEIKVSSVKIGRTGNARQEIRHVVIDFVINRPLAALLLICSFISVVVERLQQPRLGGRKTRSDFQSRLICLKGLPKFSGCCIPAPL